MSCAHRTSALAAQFSGWRRNCSHGAGNAPTSREAGGKARERPAPPRRARDAVIRVRIAVGSGVVAVTSGTESISF